MEGMEMNFKNKKVLVTGGTGFVGSHLVEALIKEGAAVVTTFQSLNPMSYFFTQKLNKKVIMEQVDLVDYYKVMDLVTKFEIEYIFHLGAQALVGVAYCNPRRTYESNIMGTVNVLEAARLYPGVKAVVVASSDKAYGKAGNKKYTEEMSLRGDHPYEASKSSADLISQSYYKTYDLPVTIARFGNIYGEGDLHFSRIFPGMIQAIIDNKVLDIRSDGKFVRDYLYVKDVVNGYLLLAKNINKAKGQAYNFGSSNTLSVIELIQKIEKSLKKNIKYEVLNISQNEIPYQSLNFDKVKKQFGWSPNKTINKTISNMYGWYEDILCK